MLGSGCSAARRGLDYGNLGRVSDRPAEFDHRRVRGGPDWVRSERYTIIELSMFEGRSVAAKKRLMQLLFERTGRELGLAPVDLELTISETPKHNWAFRGLPGDEHALGYKVEV